MPDNEPLSQEAAAKAAMREAEHYPATATGLSDENALAREILQRREKDGAESALESARQLAKSSGPLDRRGRFDQYTEERFGWERDADGRIVRTGEVETRYRDAEKYKEAGRRLAEEGYDSLNNTQKRLVRTQVESALNRYPHIQQELSGLREPTRTRLIEDMLKRPDFAANFRSIFEGNIDEFIQNNPDIRQEVARRKEELDQAEREIDKNRNEKRQVGTKLREVTGKLSEFDAGGTKATELEGVINDINTLRTELNNQKSLRATADRDIKEKRAERSRMGRGDPDRATVTGEIDGLETDIQTYNQRIAEVEQEIKEKEEEKQKLLQEKAEHERQKREQEEKLEQLQEETQDLLLKKSRAQTEYEIIKNDKVRQEQELINEFQKTLADATIEYMDNKMSEIEEAHNKILEEKAQKASSEAEEKMFKALETRYGKSVRSKRLGIDRGWKYEYNRAQIDSDWQTLMGQGPKEVARSIITANGLDPNLADNKEFLEKVQADMLKKLVGARIKKGGISNGEAEILINSDWGAAAVNGAIAENEAKTNQLRELLAKEGISGDPIEFIRKNKGKTIIGGIGLAAILAILAFGGVGAAALSAAGAKGLSSRI